MSLDETNAQKLRGLLVAHGPEAIAERFGLGAVTLLRAAVGLRVHYATHVAILQALTEGR